MEDNERRPDLFDRLFMLPFFRHFAPFFHRHREVLLYLLFGVLTTLVSWGSFYYFCYLLALNELLANALSWVLAVLFAYLTNRAWVFDGQKQPFFRGMLLFFAARLATLGVEEGILFLFVTTLGYDAMLVKIVGNVAVLILNYLLSKLVVFRKRS